MFSHHQVLFVNFSQTIHGQRFPVLGVIFAALVVAVAVYLVYTLVQVLFDELHGPKSSRSIRADKMRSTTDSVSSTDSLLP